MPKQERAVQTRQSVLEAAGRVFAEQGYDAATMQSIQERAGVTKGALYFHFDSKVALAQALIAAQVDWLEAQLARLSIGVPPVQQILDISFAFADALRSDPIVRASIRLSVERGTFRPAAGEGNPYQDWVDAATVLFGKAKTAGQLRDGVRPVDAAVLVTGTITGVQLASEAMTGYADLDKRLRIMWSALLPGLVTQQALEQLRPRRAGRSRS